MTKRKWSENKAPFLIGLIAEGLSILAAIVFLIIVAFSIYTGRLEGEAAGWIIVGSIAVVAAMLVFSAMFILNFVLYRQVIIDGTTAHTASKVFLFHLIYGLILTFIIPVVHIGIPYLISGFLGIMKTRQ